MGKKPGPKAKKGPKKKAAPSGVSTRTLGEMLGLTDQRISQLVALGMPRAGRGMYPTKDSVRWYVEYLRKGGEKAATDGPTKSDLEREILMEKLKEQRGLVFDRGDVLATWSAAHARLAKGLDGFATTMGREMNLTGDDTKMMRDRLDDLRRDYVIDCKEFRDVVDDASSSAEAA